MSDNDDIVSSKTKSKFEVRRAQMRAIVRERNEQLSEMWEEVQCNTRCIALPDHYVAEAKSLGCTWVLSAHEAATLNKLGVPLDVLAFHLDALNLHQPEPIDWDLSRFTWLYDESRDRLKCRDNVTGLTKSA
jgi:hypothetical protein